MVLCGPTADTATLKVNAEVRVYERGPRVYGCARGGASFALGDRVVSVRIAGHFAAVIRQGESLQVYDLRKRRTRGLRIRATQFTQYRLTRYGDAAFLATTPYGQFIGETAEGGWFQTTADPYYLRFAGSALATRHNGRVQLQGLDIYTDDGVLAVVGRIRIDTLRLRLRARLGSGRPMFIGSPRSACSSPTDCGEGISSLRLVADRYVIADGVTVYDLARREVRPCEDVPVICATG
jgi:hypothetical protein